MSEIRRFIVLHHDWPEPHYDLMLEQADGLWTWRIPTPLHCRSDEIALRLPDHRLMYLDYEGPVSGGRGTVRRFQEGIYVLGSVTDQTLRWWWRSDDVEGLAELQQVDGDRWRLTCRPRSMGGAEAGFPDVLGR